MVSRAILALLLPLAATGCVSAATAVVKAPFTAVSVAQVPFKAVSVAEVPFKAGGKVVDWTTTSPSERDRAYVRRTRKAEERERRERAKRCHKRPDDPDCRTYAGYRPS